MIEKPQNGYEELIAKLSPNETVEAIVFGEYGWGEYDPDETYSATRLRSKRQNRILRNSLLMAATAHQNVTRRTYGQISGFSG